jgi:hypothetical protein
MSIFLNASGDQKWSRILGKMQVPPFPIPVNFSNIHTTQLPCLAPNHRFRSWNFGGSRTRAPCSREDLPPPLSRTTLVMVRSLYRELAFNNDQVNLEEFDKEYIKISNSFCEKKRSAPVQILCGAQIERTKDQWHIAQAFTKGF